MSDILSAILAAELSRGNTPMNVYADIPQSKNIYLSNSGGAGTSGWGCKNGVALYLSAAGNFQLVDLEGNVLVATLTTTLDSGSFSDPVYLTDDIVVVKNSSVTAWVLNFYKISTNTFVSYTVPTTLTGVTSTQGIGYANGKIFCVGTQGSAPWCRLVTLNFNEATLACSSPSALITVNLNTSTDYWGGIAGNTTSYYIISYSTASISTLFEVAAANLTAFLASPTGNFTRSMSLNGLPIISSVANNGGPISGAVMYVEGNNLVIRSSQSPIVIDIPSWTVKSYGNKGTLLASQWDKITINGKVLNWTVEYELGETWSSSGSVSFWYGVAYLRIYTVKSNGQPVSRKYRIPNSETYKYNRTALVQRIVLTNGRYVLSYGGSGFADSPQTFASFMENADVHNIIMEMSGL